MKGIGALPTAIWSHLAATYDGSTLRLYVNGVEVANAPISGNLGVSNGVLRIGGNAALGEYFNGTIDDLRIYDRALSSVEVQSDMATPVPGAAAAASLSGGLSLALSNATVPPGGTANLDLSLNAGATAGAASLQWTLAYSPADLSSVTVTPSGAVTAAGKSLMCTTDVGAIRCILFGMNTGAIPNGSIATISSPVPATTPNLSSQIQLMSVVASDAAANPLAVTATGATVTIDQPGLNGLSCVPTTLAAPSTSTCTVALTSPAPVGGTSVALSVAANAVTVPSTVAVPQGASSTTFTAAPKAVSSSTSETITAFLKGVSQGFGLTINPPTVSLSGIGVSPTAITSGQTTSVTVTLTNPAGTGGASVSLVSSNVSAAPVPTSVTVAQGSTSATVSLKAGTVSATTSVTLTASYAGVSKTAVMTVNPALVTAALSSVAVSPTSVTGGGSSTGTVTLSAAAGTGGVTVSLSSSNTLAATLPSSVTIPSGTSIGTFSVTTKSVTSTSAVTLTASYSGVSKTASLTVNPAPVTAALSSVAISPMSVTGGGPSTGTVTLTAPAGTGGVAVALSSSNTGAVTVPPSVTIAAGASSATFPLSTNAVSTTTSVSVTASYSGVSKTATLTVNPAAASTSFLLGNQAVETRVDSNPGGKAEAFQTSAIASGTLSTLTFYLDASSAARSVSVGLYSDSSGHPGSLLTQGSTTSLVKGGWNTISVPATAVSAGTTYWIAILSTSGTVAYRDRSSGPCKSEANKQNNLKTLPSAWSSSKSGNTCPVSVFGR